MIYTHSIKSRTVQSVSLIDKYHMMSDQDIVIYFELFAFSRLIAILSWHPPDYQG